MRVTYTLVTCDRDACTASVTHHGPEHQLGAWLVRNGWYSAAGLHRCPRHREPKRQAPAHIPAPRQPADSPELRARVSTGDSEAFAAIVAEHHWPIYRFLLRRCGDRQLAEDLTQDTFVRAFRRVHTYEERGVGFGAWLVTIARNLLTDHFRSGWHRMVVATGDILDAEKQDHSPEGMPDATVVDHITNLALLTAVKQLNPEQQECIVLRFLHGFSVAETAEAMGKNEGAVKAMQYRAVQNLARSEHVQALRTAVAA